MPYCDQFKFGETEVPQPASATLGIDAHIAWILTQGPD